VSHGACSGKCAAIARSTCQKLTAMMDFQVAIKVQADPNRLLRNTTASAMRIAAEKENDHSAKDSGYIRYVPRKAGGGVHA
jgi:hypothetical protein